MRSTLPLAFWRCHCGTGVSLTLAGARTLSIKPNLEIGRPQTRSSEQGWRRSTNQVNPDQYGARQNRQWWSLHYARSRRSSPRREGRRSTLRRPCSSPSFAGSSSPCPARIRWHTRRSVRLRASRSRRWAPHRRPHVAIAWSVAISSAILARPRRMAVQYCA